MGLATGWALKRRGVEATVYEQFAVGNQRASSHGRSRIFRLAYAEPEYVRLAQEALGLWRELEAETGETLLELYGLVEIVRTLEESTAHTLERCGVDWERLDREEAERRYPIHVPEGSFAVVQPEAGIVRPDKALPAFARGLELRENTRAHPDEVEADAVVVTAGSWVNELLERITAWARETYRLADPDPVAAETCMYTTTADETFILERRGRVVVGSPCSGHGFKFAPAIGERLAALAMEALERSGGPLDSL